MKIHLLLLLSLGCVAAHAQSQEGFLTLICGMTPENYTYTDPTTNVTVISDAAFIDSGESRTTTQATFLRSFPRGRRNCYDLDVTRGRKYMVGAKFLYGNYDNRNEKPTFDLHIGPNKWDTVDMEETGVSVARSKQIVHVSTSNVLQVCLVKTGTTTPFISSLQLRPLSNDVYDTDSPNVSLVTLNRFHFGNNLIRFPNDRFDRVWSPLLPPSIWNVLKTTHNVNTSGMYNPPEVVMQTAATPKNASLKFGVFLRLADPTQEFRVYMYFAEIEELKPDETREFDIELNGFHFYGPIRLEKFHAQTINLTVSQRYCKDGYCELVLRKTSTSTRLPILNAFEVYSLVKFLQPETDQNEVETMKRIKKTYGLRMESWEGDPCSPLQLMWDGLSCTSQQPPSITSLNLSSSGLEGTISPWIQNLTRLKELDLSNNTLRGGIPEFLASMASLSIIDLRNNKLSGSVPRSLLIKARNGSLSLLIQGNPDIYCRSDVCKDRHLQNKSEARRITIPTVASVASVFVLSVALAIFIIYRKRSSIRKGARPTTEIIQTQRRFTRSDVLKMTNNLEKLLGRGRFGVLYQGFLNETEQVAVEILSDPTSLDLKQFNEEVELLLRIHHKNLVHLVGYSNEGDDLALIYEHMANGDLKHYLSGEDEGETLSWVSRLKIAMQAAEGLLYLHKGCDPPMVHGDIKTSNIVLGEHFQAKVANFGLATSRGTQTESLTSSHLAGTPGYIDPEYQKTSWLTDKSDVYSFGVVLLEMLTNQPVLDQTREGEHISEWIQRMLEKKADIAEIVDPRLQGEYRSSSVWKALELATACVSLSCNNRPSMLHVVAQLSQCLAVETWTGREGQAFGSNSGPLSTSLTIPR
ncbi:PREDICTED: probable LRR receptor-like serine/threonine-protein kinase At1g51810 [Tarenaya hassleriana]|uniref:probable LRR receptor-like serine/threonine-protein kinase At1g51810 n=1 Tax=Tarenaya hassleriana TaxID=28532 RepID=UPI00053C5F35|nr:PREDICTED: probable LRR receptor-like serine/threonine-protein kinase At1g51810 [Tarenaya hassleriana]